MNATMKAVPGKRNAREIGSVMSVSEARAVYVRALVESVLGPANHTDAAILVATAPAPVSRATPGKLPFTVAAVRALVGIDAIHAIGLK